MIRLTDKVRRYNRKLRDLGLKDHQVERATTQRKLRNLLLLIYRSNLLLAWAILALPGVITHAPIFIPAKMYSKVKAKGIYLVTSIYPCKRADFRYHLAEALAASSVKIAARDVIATWKILFSLAATPALYIVYAILATWLAWRNGASSTVVKSMPALIFVIMPFFAMSSLKFGEAGMDVFKSVSSLPAYTEYHRSSPFPADHYDRFSFPCCPEVRKSSKNCAKPENRSPTSCPR